MIEDRLLEVAQRRPRLEPERCERAAGILVRRERVGLAAARVEGEHELSPHALAEWIGLHESFELGNELGGDSELEVDVDPLLQRREPESFELRPLAVRPLERNAVEDLAAPERECCTVSLPRGCKPSCAPLFTPRCEDRSEARRVQLLIVDAEDVTAPVVVERRAAVAVVCEDAAETRDVSVQALACGRRRLIAPEVVDQSVGRDCPVRSSSSRASSACSLSPGTARSSPPTSTWRGPRMRNSPRCACRRCVIRPS